jgi:hypothetical protein
MQKGIVDVKHLFRWAQLIFTVVATAVIAGCVEEEIVLTLNPDGSGTLDVRIKVDDRMMVPLEANAASTAEEYSGMKITRWDAPLLLKPEEPTLRKMLSPDFEITHFESLIEGEVREVKFTCTWTDPNVFEQSIFKKLVRLTPKVTLEGKGNIWTDLFDGRVPSWSDSSSSNSGQMLANAYSQAKGFRRSLTLNMPGEVQSTSGRLSEDMRQVNWDFDLRDRTQLTDAQKLVDALSPYNVEATFDPTQFDASAVEAWSIAPVSTETSSTDDQSSPSDAEECPCKLFVENIHMGRPLVMSFRNNDANVTMNTLYLSYDTWCGNVDNLNDLKPLKSSDIQILEVLDRNGKEISSLFLDPREGESAGLEARLQHKEGDVLPEIAMIKSRVLITMPGEITSLSLTLGQLRAMAGKVETGIPLLDANEVLVERIDNSEITFTFLPDLDGSAASRVSSVRVIVDGEEKAMRNSGHAVTAAAKSQSYAASNFDELPDETTVILDVVMDGFKCEAVSEFEVPNL